VAIDVTDTDLVVACDDCPRTVRRTNTLPIRNLKAQPGPKVTPSDPLTSFRISNNRSSSACATVTSTIIGDRSVTSSPPDL
jgi:hypothetical protein